ncbi:MAG: hypothetical protein JXA52_05055 [Planctomycetes bacterium]|nr:hypothetical protein [Planctomycetota bacterium]
MHKFQKIIFLLLLFTVTLGLGGCLSQLFGFDTGGKLIWWCDKCQAQVGSQQTHVCGMTQYDPATGRDVPMAGITQEEINQAIADREADAAAQESDPSTQVQYLDEDPPQKSKPKWKFWGN